STGESATGAGPAPPGQTRADVPPAKQRTQRVVERSPAGAGIFETRVLRPRKKLPLGGIRQAAEHVRHQTSPWIGLHRFHLGLRFSACKRRSYPGLPGTTRDMNEHPENWLAGPACRAPEPPAG